MSNARLYARGAAIVAAGLILLWLSVATSIYFVSAAGSPDVARAWWPWGAEGQARAAEALTIGPNAARSASAASRLSIAALAREPVNVRASRVLGISRSLTGDSAGALRLFRYSEVLSRRDVPTQLALIEAAVQANRIDLALVHYDRAMRTSAPSIELLVPVLSGAADDVEVARPLAQFVAKRPVWWPYFFDTYLPQSRNPASLAVLAASARFDPSQPADTAYLTRVLLRLVELGAYPAAEQLYERTTKTGPANKAIVRDGAFERDNPVTPFDWALTDEEGRRGTREQRAENLGTSLSLEGNMAGPVARQIISLNDGNYRLRATVGSVGSDDGQPSIAVVCAGTGAAVVRLNFPAAESARQIATDFAFARKPGCETQWLSIDLGGTLDRPLAAPWVDNVAVEPLR